MTSMVFVQFTPNPRHFFAVGAKSVGSESKIHPLSLFYQETRDEFSYTLAWKFIHFLYTMMQ